MFKLLIADDERLIREALSTTIDWKMYDIELIGICRNGIEAYDMILDESPDIVLTDIRMPGMSGLDLIRPAKPAFPSNSLFFLDIVNLSMQKLLCNLESNTIS